MLEIDGSHGEGGGQILRTSISLSSTLSQPVKIVNIRANRPNAGLAPSHVTSIEAVAQISDAEVDGLFPGSKEIVFKPGQLTGGDFEFDVGTAGSISLVIQSCLLPAILSKSRTELTVSGGTDVRWSPPIDFMSLVHLPLLQKFGPAFDIETSSRGFYPEGGGKVSVEVFPTTKLSPVVLGSQGKVLSIDGVAYAQNLPEHVVSRMKNAALKRLLDFREVRIDSDLRKGHSTGAGIVASARCSNTVLGASALGAKGVKAEALGEDCASDLLETIRSGATVDDNMLDQILLYMAVAEQGSVLLAEEMTEHAKTNIWVIERFLGKKFDVTRKEGLSQVMAV